MMNLKIIQRNAVALLLDDGTYVIAVLLMVFNVEFYLELFFIPDGNKGLGRDAMPRHK